jgi:hypothetical protein
MIPGEGLKGVDLKSLRAGSLIHVETKSGATGSSSSVGMQSVFLATLTTAPIPRWHNYWAP